MGQGIDDYATFFPVLATCVARTSGSILELGAGHYSTPLLHMMARIFSPELPYRGLPSHRTIITAETDERWIEKFKDLETEWHRFSLVRAWKTFEEIERNQWSVALVDSAPGEERPDLAMRLKGRCRFQVWHDVEELDRSTPCGGNYGWSKIIDKFKYVYLWKRYRPWTAVVSDEEEFNP